MPQRGRFVGNNVRELTAIRPYVIRYLIDESGDVYIVTIRHGAREPL